MNKRANTGPAIVLHVGFHCVRCRNYRTRDVTLAPVDSERNITRTYALDADEYRVCNDCANASDAETVRRRVEAFTPPLPSTSSTTPGKTA